MALPLDEAGYARFAEGFRFLTTPDQQKAIDAVIADMAMVKPMDRVVCGDVGFGKTEVALRAAFAAAANGKQVWIADRGRGEYDEHNNMLWADGFLSDISEQRLAQQQAGSNSQWDGVKKATQGHPAELHAGIGEGKQRQNNEGYPCMQPVFQRFSR